MFRSIKHLNLNIKLFFLKADLPKLNEQTKIILENMLNPDQDKRWDWSQIEENLFEIED